jgi:transcriptional regulator with XRE-family HTH domain
MTRVEKIREKLRDRRLYMVAEATGMTYQGLLNIVNGRTKEPKDSTMNRLEAYLNRESTNGQPNTVPS